MRISADTNCCRAPGRGQRELMQGLLVRARCSLVPIEELRDAMERITDERSRTNRSLEMIRPEQVGKSSSQFLPTESKKANPKIDLSAYSEWRARSDSNARPSGS